MSFNNEQMSMDFNSKDEKVVVLGMEFKNHDERREYFRNELRKKLSELKKVEGYPIGEDEDVIALSDPPYYTACPNPWIHDFIEEWRNQNKNELYYQREPFAADVSEGKSDRIYNVHSYHTKVPHKAVMRYILHYTEPGDVVLDGFSGTGMTGIATKYSNSKEEIEKLGYYVDESGNVFDEEKKQISKVGERHAVMTDLSPAASLISQSYNNNLDEVEYQRVARSIIGKLKKKTEWMFETVDSFGERVPINYSVWSDVFTCYNCSNEIVFWDISVDEHEKKMRKEMFCPNCNAEVTKKKMTQVFTMEYDTILERPLKVPKQVQVLINYTSGKTRYNKRPEKFDNDLQMKINEYKISGFVPKDLVVQGDETDRLKRNGIEYVHQIYTKRNLVVMSEYYELIKENKFFTELLNVMRSSNSYSTKMVKVNIPRLLDKGGIFSFGFVSGTFYIPSLNGERPMLDAIQSKLKNMVSTIDSLYNSSVISNQSTTDLKNIENESIDYIFVDPPFGANLMYSELNSFSESWMKLFTNNNEEAIMNKYQGKGLLDYQKLMEQCFKELFRVLKSNRWITVEFSNSQASVWNSIREALERAGFVIANVSSLDKKQGSFKALTTTVAVKQDLVISAYKPQKKLRENFVNNRNNNSILMWDFIDQHLANLALPKVNGGEIHFSTERTPRILFDRLIAYFVQNGLSIPLSSAEFQRELSERYQFRDGMFFLEEQAIEFDKKRILAKHFAQLELFVSDENSAIEWIRQQLMKKPKTRQDIHPIFMKEIQHITKYEDLPELDELLAQNFLMYDGRGVVPNQIRTYLTQAYHDLRGLDNGDSILKERAMNRWYVPNPNQQVDLEKIREKNLLREFNRYVEEIDNSKKKLKFFRTEAIRVGFKKAWTDKDYQKIVTIGERLPEKIIQEDDKLLMYFDNAQMRTEM
ncbi:DNA methyltransferase [Carnobacterium inhibens]|uniref:DNA methyltransferase n=1 Tax=Carnobacterium inhibens TaxID=147709 RepID=UPI0005586D45|nr:DNA methyltransferase [Carnobacterium inhibens]